MPHVAQMTKEELMEFKRQRLEDIRAYHADLIRELGITPNDFQMKMLFYNKQGKLVVGIFPSEFERENGFYFEIINRDYEPQDFKNRTIYRIPKNDAYQEEYEMTSKGSYLVPLEELRVVNPASVAISGASAIIDAPTTAVSGSFRPVGTIADSKPSQQTAYRAPGPMEDAPFSQMTIRDYVAIKSSKPVSAKPWLNELIKTLNNK